jgi:DUF4097 and DUF4098 domain-containing protein YvlB
MLLAVMMVLALMPGADSDQWSKSYKVEGPSRLRVETGDANIHITSVEGGSIEAHVTTQNMKIGGDGIQIIDRQNGNDVSIEVKFPRHWLQMNFRSRRVDIDLTVPRHIGLDLRTGDGNIEIRGVEGNSALKSGDGRIVIEDVEGTFRAESGDGGVNLKRTHGDFSLQSGDGKIDVEDFDGALHVQTGDGPVRVSGRFDVLEVKTGDGRVEAVAQRGSKLASDWTLRTGDGGLTVRLPGELAADLDLHTGDGQIDLGFPVTIQGRADKKTIRGKLNEGGRLLTIQTGDGSIRLERL